MSFVLKNKETKYFKAYFFSIKNTKAIGASMDALYTLDALYALYSILRRECRNTVPEIEIYKGWCTASKDSVV